MARKAPEHTCPGHPHRNFRFALLRNLGSPYHFSPNKEGEAGFQFLSSLVRPLRCRGTMLPATNLQRMPHKTRTAQIAFPRSTCRWVSGTRQESVRTIFGARNHSSRLSSSGREGKRRENELSSGGIWANTADVSQCRGGALSARGQ